MKSTLIALMTLGLLTSSALAQGEKKAELETGEKKATNVFRPDADKEKEAGIDPERARVDAIVAEKEKKLSVVRQRQIKSMRKILRDKPNYKKKADLLFRIAEKEWEEGKYQYFLKRKQYDKQIEAYFNKTLSKKPEEPVADYSKALKEYKTLLKQFPNYKRIDAVMFYLGRGLQSAGKKKEGASYMLRLTKEYPKSKFVTRAYLAVAEYYFDNDLLFAAKENYLKVLEDKKNAEYAYALYKLGYVYYNLKEYEDSIKAFQGVADKSKGGQKKKVYFTNQAYNGMALAYAEVPDGWKRARDYFRKKGGDKLAVDYLEKIARIYNKQDKTDDEVAVYEYLIGADKQGPKVPEYAEYITAAYKKQENVVAADKVINRFFDYLDPKGSWYAVNKDKEEPMTRARQYREEQVDWLIGTYHTKAQELEKKKVMDKADAYYKNAAKYYEIYIKSFPESKTLYEKEFYLAEIFFYQMKDWENSATWYAATVKRDPKGKFSKDSAYQVILAREAQMADAGLVPKPDWINDLNKSSKKKKKAKKASVEYTKRNKDDKEFKPKPKVELKPATLKFLEACTAYLDTYPKDKEVPSISFRAAEIFINNGHYAEGIKRLEVIMEYHPKHEFASFAAATLFDSNYRLRRWDQMERWARYMMKKRNYKVLSKKQLQSVIAVSINNYAKELRDKGKKQEAVDQWLRFAKEFPKHEGAPAALFNAAAVTEELEQTEKSIDLYESLIKRHKTSDQASEAHFVLGALYESQTEFEKAAGYFEKMADIGLKKKKGEENAELDKKTADSLYNAGAIRSALEQFAKAEAIYQDYVKLFDGKRDDVHEVYLEIARLQLKQKKYKAAHKTYDKYIKKYGKTYPDRVVTVYLDKAKIDQEAGGKRARKNATRNLKNALKAFKKLPEDVKTGTALKSKIARKAAADAQFRLGEYIYSDFSDVKVRFPQSVLRKTLVKKAKLMQEAEKVYFEVLDYKAHDINAGALFRIGEGYYLFAKSLFDLPIPEELTEDEKIIYRAELDDQAAPLQEKAIEAMGRALKLAHKNHVYNEWSRRSAAILVKLSPEAFPVLDDAVVNTEWEVPATFSTNFISDPNGKLEMMMQKKPEPKQAEPKAGKAGMTDAAGKATDAAKKAVADESAKKAAAGKDAAKDAAKAAGTKATDAVKKGVK